jgi:hypothetical protein
MFPRGNGKFQVIITGKAGGLNFLTAQNGDSKVIQILITGGR